MKKRQLHFGGKMLVLVLALTVLLTNVVLPVMAEESIAEGYTYTLSENNEATITGYTVEPTGEITIPATIDGYPVVAIGENAFSLCEEITSVIIEEGISIIGGYSFEDCSKIKSIVIPKSVSDIGGGAFMCCSALESIQIPNGVTVIEPMVFAGCKSLKSLSLPDGVTIIGKAAFSSCTSLETIILPDGLNTIMDQVFEDCTSLVTIEFPMGLLDLGADEFCGCTSLTSITIPNSIKELYSITFTDCPSLKTIYYNGTQEEWEQLEKDNKYFDFLSVEVICMQTVNLDSNGVKVDASTNEIDSNTKLNVELQETGSVVISDLENYDVENAVVYNLYLSKNGEVVQPSGNVTVSIPVPASMDGSKCKVFYIDDAGIATDMNAILKDGYMVFAVNHFSYYAVVEVLENTNHGTNDDESNDEYDDTNENVSDDTNKGTNSDNDNDATVTPPQTSDNSTTILWTVLFMTLIGLAVGTKLVSKKHAK